MDAIMALCKRRGFIYQASEIYGGINGFWDYGPLGAQLKKNLREAWWQDMIMRPAWGQNGPNGAKVRCVPLETRIIQHPKVWEASGHVGGFNDPMVDDKETKQRFRADHLQGLYLDATVNMQNVSAEALAPAQHLLHDKRRPAVTIVAGTTGEALQQLMTDKRTQKMFGIRSISSSAQNRTLVPADSIFVEVDFGQGVARHVVKAVPIKELDEHPQDIPSPFSGKKGALTEPRQFNLMFISYTGAVFNEENKVYLRPETAQGIFVQFKNVVDTNRIKVPFGIGNTGTSFRNEVTPRNFTFRSREFDQMELEFFCHPDESHAWYKFWRDFRMEWWKSIGLAGENLILREHAKDELSHYSVGTSDVEYRFPFTAPGFGELEGIAHRGNYDLTQHQTHSKARLEYNDAERGELLPNGSRRGERYLPHCIEPAAGLDRGVLALLCEGYTKDETRASPEFLKLHPRLAPVKAAVFPLVAKDGMPEVAEKLHAELTDRFWRIGNIEMDEKQSIGKRYARMDEAGTPYCITIDNDTLTGQVVTIRDRDTAKQEKVAIDKVSEWLTARLGV
jgi:glycyl-tRNA synthetase